MERENLKFVVLGHVDHGKSTLIGRLLYDTGSLPEQKMAELRQICNELGSQVEFAFLLDQFEEERLSRMTIDTTEIFFKTELRDYVIIDAPGHKQFLKNMITGTSQADGAVLVVDVAEGLGEQTYRHLRILKILGLQKILVLINKMDLVGFEREPFEALLIEALSCLRRFDLWPLAVIPVSARNGDNLTDDRGRWPVTVASPGYLRSQRRGCERGADCLRGYPGGPGGHSIALRTECPDQVRADFKHLPERSLGRRISQHYFREWYRVRTWTDRLREHFAAEIEKRTRGQCVLDESKAVETWRETDLETGYSRGAL